MNIFISGGCKNGKSMYAQKLAKEMADTKGTKLYYIATMIPTDDEDRRRIERHIDERSGWGFETLEQGTDICRLLKDDVEPRGAFLLDSVTALLSNEMFKSDGTCNLGAGKKVANELTDFAKQTGNTVFVSDYIYSDAKIFDGYTERYRESLAHIDRQLASICDQVIEVAYGNTYYYNR